MGKTIQEDRIEDRPAAVITSRAEAASTIYWLARNRALSILSERGQLDDASPTMLDSAIGWVLFTDDCPDTAARPIQGGGSADAMALVAAQTYPDIIQGRLSEIPAWGLSRIRQAGANPTACYIFVGDLASFGSQGVYHVRKFGDGCALVCRAQPYGPKVIHDVANITPDEVAAVLQAQERLARFTSDPIEFIARSAVDAIAPRAAVLKSMATAEPADPAAGTVATPGTGDVDSPAAAAAAAAAVTTVAATADTAVSVGPRKARLH